MAEKCKECGCVCVNCSITGFSKKYDIVDEDDDNNGEMHLHLEIENLRQRLLERDSHIVTMETQFLNEADKFPNGELASMKEEMLKWQDKYTRLYESHKRVQKVNQNLEDKLLRIVDKCETEKSAFTKDIATLSHRLADANYTIHRLTQDNEKYRNDVNLAIQLLQCKPSNFVGQRYDSLPSEVQAKVRSYVAQKRVTPSSNESGGVTTTTTSSGGVSENFKSITVPISTFPPTAMVYNVTKTSNADKDSDEESDDSKPPVDIVSAAIMAKVLEERERERVFAKHCDTCTCHRSILTNDVQTQTFEDNCERHDDDDDDDGKKKKKTIFYKDNNVVCNSEFDSENIIVDNLNISSINNRQDRGKDCISSKSAAAAGVNGKLINNIDVEYIDERNTRKKNVGNGGEILTKEEKKTTTKTSFQYSPIKESSMIFSNKKNSSSSSNFRQNDRSSVREMNSVYRFAKTKSSEWKKYEKLPSQDIDLNDFKNGGISEMEIDIMNKRVLRNNEDDDDDIENVLSSSSSSRENRKMISDFIIGKTSSEKNCFNVINDRVWKKNSIDEIGGGGGSSSRSDSGLGVAIKSVGLTLIEVKNSPTIYKNKDDKKSKEKESSIGLDMQSEDTASPSFSSDSLLISSSDPPSTSSEFCNPKRLTDVKKSSVNDNDSVNNNNNINSKKNNFNNVNKNNFTSSNSLMSNWQDRTTGPRGCSMRITPGSKNILLDNAGNYKTVLYTSGTNNGYNDRFKPKITALVHHNVAKSNRSGGSTSTSTSTSEENSPVLPNDDSQLQRVAEWVKASGPSDVVDRVAEMKSARYGESIEKKSVEEVDKVNKELREGKNEDDVDDDEKNKKKKRDNNIKKLDRNFVRDDDDDDDGNSLSFDVVNNEKEKENNAVAPDLISFESSNDDIDYFDVNNKKILSSVDLSSNIAKDDRFNINLKSDESLSSLSNNIDVKVTREMEETYLKLAASLDPANLKLSNTDNTDITLEKYRKKYKKK